MSANNSRQDLVASWVILRYHTSHLIHNLRQINPFVCPAIGNYALLAPKELWRENSLTPMWEWYMLRKRQFGFFGHVMRKITLEHQAITGGIEGTKQGDDNGYSTPGYLQTGWNWDLLSWSISFLPKKDTKEWQPMSGSDTAHIYDDDVAALNSSRECGTQDTAFQATI